MTKNKVSTSGSQQKTANESREIETLKRENNNIFSNLKELENKQQKIYGEMTEMIRELARNYERLHKLGDYSGAVNTICATIVNELKQKGCYGSVSTAYQVLDAKYKQEEYSHPDESTNSTTTSNGAGFSSSGHVSPDSSGFYMANNSGDGQTYPSYPDPNVQVPMNPLKQKLQPTGQMSDEFIRQQAEYWALTDKQLKENAREAGKRKDFFLELAQDRKIALDPEIVKIEDPALSTPVDVSGETALYNSLVRYGNLILKAAEKVYKFKPNDKDARKWSKAVDTMAELWKPWADEKYRKDSVSWMLVQMDNLAHGKHAAATMHSTITPEGIKRALTREQVGDKYETVLQQAVKFTTAYGDMIGMHRWHMETAERRIASRAVSMHGKLSEKS